MKHCIKKYVEYTLQSMKDTRNHILKGLTITIRKNEFVCRLAISQVLTHRNRPLTLLWWIYLVLCV